MKNFIQYITRDHKKLHYRELIKDGDSYKVTLPIQEDHLVCGIFIDGIRKTSTILMPVEQSICTGLISLDLIQKNEYHSLNRELVIPESELKDFKKGRGDEQGGSQNESINVHYLLVAAGGGGGSRRGSGGGAGAVLTSWASGDPIKLEVDKDIRIVVGEKGLGGHPGSYSLGSTGSSSVLFNLIAYPGEGGFSMSVAPNRPIGVKYGNTAGASALSPNDVAEAEQGNQGGVAAQSGNGGYGGGGAGAGAGSSPGPNNNNNPYSGYVNGGDGVESDITGVNVIYARGGDAVNGVNNSPTRNVGTNTGDGGHGNSEQGGNSNGGYDAADGVVVVRFNKSHDIVAGPNLTYTEHVVGDDRVVIFTAGDDVIQIKKTA